MLRVCLGQCNLFLSCTVQLTAQTGPVCPLCASKQLLLLSLVGPDHLEPSMGHGSNIPALPGHHHTPQTTGLFLRLHLNNMGIPQSLPEAEQRSWVHPGEKPGQSAAEFVLGRVCSEHSLCPTEPPWACAVPHHHLALGYPSPPCPRAAP